jgi:hypothetical protein
MAFFVNDGEVIADHPDNIALAIRLLGYVVHRNDGRVVVTDTHTHDSAGTKLRAPLNPQDRVKWRKSRLNFIGALENLQHQIKSQFGFFPPSDQLHDFIFGKPVSPPPPLEKESYRLIVRVIE